MAFLGPFPRGNVSTLRIISYCKSLVKRGYAVKVYILAPTTEASVNTNKQGVFEGIEYEYLTDITWSTRNPHFILKVIYYFCGIFKFIFKVKQDSLVVLLTYHSSLFFNVIMKLVTKSMGVCFVLDKTEYPVGRTTPSVIEKIKLKCFDKIVTISKELQLFFSQYSKDVFLLPMSIDPDRYAQDDSVQIKNNKVTVIFGTHNRDCIMDSIQGFIRFVRKTGNKSLKLSLVGNFDRLCNDYPENRSILSLIDEENMEDRIIFEGEIPNDQIPYYLMTSKILLTTPRFFVSGGFPTKLGEYLLSGSPVIATKAGELADYLHHREDLIFVEPGNIQEIAEAICWVEDNEMESKLVAKKGQETAKRLFNADTYMDDFERFLAIK